MRVLLAEDLAAQLLAELVLHLLVVGDRGFPRLDRLAPALDRLVLFSCLDGGVVALLEGFGGFVPRVLQLGAEAVQALERPAQGQAGGVEIVDGGRVEAAGGWSGGCGGSGRISMGVRRVGAAPVNIARLLLQSY
ncbi:MAG: hypothetical protein M0D55_03065 [Elusimicrobiota bacterium]|nr:MAG: hypothetical protein M0D55_03065 [Elusimicrobiota bacterium]